MDQRTILSIHYLPGIYWFRKLMAGNAVLDGFEHYRKQSYRNRCVILSGNGPLALTIPVHKDVHHQPVREIKIDNESGWQKQHWEAIRSAYNSSPYFMHYEDVFKVHYHTEFEYLAEFNLELIRKCLTILNCEKELDLSKEYFQAELYPSIEDLREFIHPKKVPEVGFRPYLQVFAEKYSFVPGLSIVDLLFNEGPYSLSFIS